jgi:uncharacterized protein
MQDDRFEWDDTKAAANFAKHRIDFFTASRVFDDPGRIDEPDDTADYGEDRYRVVGLIEGRLVTVFYTERGSRIRLISARKPSRKESYDYSRQNPPV